jgi:Flp pilus assembly protein TadG
VIFAMSDVNRRRGCRRGGSAAELALVAPVLVFILLFTIDFCRVFFAYTTITNAARNGALWLSDPLATATPSQSPYGGWTGNGLYAATLADANNLNPALTSSNVTTSATGIPTQGTTVSVTVSYQFPLITSYLGLSNINLSRTVYMQVVYQTPN